MSDLNLNEKYAFYNIDTRVVYQTGEMQLVEINRIKNAITSDLSPVFGDLGIGKQIFIGEANVGDIISTDGLSIIGNTISEMQIYQMVQEHGVDIDIEPYVAQTEQVISGKETIKEWIGARYESLRKAAYPQLGELADAIVKSTSFEDNSQLEGYVNSCLLVKEKFKKPIE